MTHIMDTVTDIVYLVTLLLLTISVAEYMNYKFREDET